MTAFVTGGSGAIGGAICVALSKLGFDVAVGYNSDEQSAKALQKKSKKTARRQLPLNATSQTRRKLKTQFLYASRVLAK